MTQHYLAGELSLRLAQLQAAAASRAAAYEVACLRREAEAAAVGTLAPVVLRALELADGLCWDALTRGDAAAFADQAAICADLHEFGVSAGLLSER